MTNEATTKANLWSIAAFIVGFAVLLGACGASTLTPTPPVNSPPTVGGVRLLKGTNILEVEEQATLQVDATDTDGDALTYLWTASNGEFLENPGPRRSPDIEYKAPRSAQDVVIKVVVNDGNGGIVETSETIRVAYPKPTSTPAPATAIPTPTLTPTPVRPTPTYTPAPTIAPTPPLRLLIHPR